METMKSEGYETVVIGGGQAGLAAGYHLKRVDRPFVILEANERIGDSWRKRWDSLRLFTPAEIDGLPGLPFPARDWTFPTKDAMADYLVRYAEIYDLPVRTGVRVLRLGRRGERFVVETADTVFEADNVVVATGADRAPRVPDFALELDAGITQLHSSEYRNPTQLRPGAVLIVGAANSGAEIALDLAPTRRTYLSGHYRRMPFGPSRSRWMTKLVGPIIVHVMTIDTPIGRRMKAAFWDRGGGAPVERVTREALAAAGVELVPRFARVERGRPVLDDERTPEVANVIWCTGFRAGLEWIDLPIHDDRGEARQYRGVAEGVPGLYFVGRPFQYSWTSAAVNGVGRDAGYVAARIAKRMTMRPGDVVVRPAEA